MWSPIYPCWKMWITVSVGSSSILWNWYEAWLCAGRGASYCQACGFLSHVSIYSLTRMCPILTVLLRSESLCMCLLSKQDLSGYCSAGGYACVQTGGFPHLLCKQSLQSMQSPSLLLSWSLTIVKARRSAQTWLLLWFLQTQHSFPAKESLSP